MVDLDRRTGDTSASQSQPSIDNHGHPPTPPSSTPPSPSSPAPPAIPHVFAGRAGTVRQVICSISLCMVMLLTQAALGMTIFGGSYTATTFDLTKDPEQQSWFAAAFSLTVGTFVLPAGRLGDLYGNRTMVVIGYTWTSLFTLLAGLSRYSHSHIFFDVTRGLQGVGMAVLLPNSLAVLARIFAPASRAKRLVFCLYAATAPNGAVLGGTFTTLLGATVGWWWGYYIMAMLCLALAVVCAIVVPSDEELRHLGHSFGIAPPPNVDEEGVSAEKHEDVVDDEDKQRIKAAPPPPHAARPPALWQRLDAVGMVLGVSGLVLFNFAWNQSLLVGWSTIYVYVLLIVGLLLLLSFAWWERNGATSPLLPPQIFNVQGGLILAALGCGWSAFSIWLFYVTQLLQRHRLYSPLGTVAAFAPCAVAGIVAAFSSERILHRFGSGAVMVLALLAFTTGISIAGTAPVEQTYWAQTFVAAVVMPFGMDMSFPSASIILSEMLPAERQGEASSLVNTVVNYSVALGLGVAGTVESHTNRSGADEVRGYRGAFYLGIGFGGLGVALAALNLGLSTRRRPFTSKAGSR